MIRPSKEEILSGKIDYTAEKLIHALQELVNFRSRLNLDKNSKEWAMIQQILIDLAKGVGSYCGLTNRNVLSDFVNKLLDCNNNLELTQLFYEFEQLRLYLRIPYFDDIELSHVKRNNK